MNSEIIACEMIKKAGYVVQRNHLYFDRSSKNISKVECFDTGVFKLMPKHLKDTFESLVISIRGHNPLQSYRMRELYFYYSTQEGLNSYKTLTDINTNEGDKTLHKNNFFTRMNLDNKDFMCGVLTPYNGFIMTHVT